MDHLPVLFLYAWISSYNRSGLHKDTHAFAFLTSCSKWEVNNCCLGSKSVGFPLKSHFRIDDCRFSGMQDHFYIQWIKVFNIVKMTLVQLLNLQAWNMHMVFHIGFARLWSWKQKGSSECMIVQVLSHSNSLQHFKLNISS